MSSRINANLYEILGVSPQAEDVVIRAAYRALAQRYHPDKSPANSKDTAAQRMSAIQKAYDILSNPISRIAYDVSLANESEAEYFPVANPFSIANIEAQAWEVLLRLHPELGSSINKLEANQKHLAKTYRSLLLELISEKLVSRLVQSVCEEIKDVKVEPQLTDSSKPHLH